MSKSRTRITPGKKKKVKYELKAVSKKRPPTLK